MTSAFGERARNEQENTRIGIDRWRHCRLYLSNASADTAEQTWLVPDLRHDAGTDAARGGN